MNTLVELQKLNKFITDKNDTHSYLEVYDNLFNHIKDAPINFLELGIYKGGSILLWRKYFTKAKIFGLDRKENVYRDDLAILEKHEIITLLLDYDKVTQETFNHLKFDVVIDDLSHELIHQIKTFNIFSDKLNPGGLLIIEDIRPESVEYWKYIAACVPNCKVFDRRPIKNRYDDVLFVYSKP